MKLRGRAAFISLRTLSSSAYLGFGLVLLLVSTVASGGVSGLRQNVLSLFSPVVSGVLIAGDSVRQWTHDVANWSSLRDENTALREKIAQMEEWQQASLMLQSENQTLRDMLRVPQGTDEKSFVTARVIADTSTSYAKSFVINTGIKDGVRKGQGVVAADGLIGRVLDDADKTARVLLLEDINSRVPVVVEGANERAILAGRNEQIPHLEHLRPDNTVQEGQRVITSGVGGVFPYGIPVGVTQKTADGHMGVRLFVDPERVEHVQVVNFGIPGIDDSKSYAMSEADAPSGEDGDATTR